MPGPDTHSAQFEYRKLTTTQQRPRQLQVINTDREFALPAGYVGTFRCAALSVCGAGVESNYVIILYVVQIHNVDLDLGMLPLLWWLGIFI